MKIFAFIIVVFTLAFGANAFARPAQSGTSSGASVSATNGVYGGYTVATFYPGSSMDKSLYIGFDCTQNGAIVLAGSTWELHYAVSAGVSGYTQIGDHFSVVISPLLSQSYTGGHLDCVVKGYAAGKRGLVSVAQSTFSID